MFEVRRFGPFPSCQLLFLFIIFAAAFLVAQDADRDKDKDKDEPKRSPAAAARMVDVKGALKCEKPSPAYSIDVPDRDGHSLIIEKRKCVWTEPLTILTGKTKEGTWVGFTERMEGALHPHTYEVDTLDDGEKVSMQTMGHVLSDKNPAVTKGRWSFTRGTGKYKGIKGGGTYEGKIDANDVLTLELAGVYEPAEMAGGKK